MLLPSLSIRRARNSSIREITPCEREQVCKPNSVSRRVGIAIIPLAQSLPIGSSDLPGGFERAARMSPPYLVLHREEFAWPRMSPHVPVRSYFKPFRAAPFHPSPARSDLRSQNLSRHRLVCFLLHLSSPVQFHFRIPLWNLEFGIRPSAPPLAGSLPCGVRTFLSFGPRPHPSSPKI
jgi:hypothetical protein